MPLIVVCLPQSYLSSLAIPDHDNIEHALVSVHGLAEEHDKVHQVHDHVHGLARRDDCRETSVSLESAAAPMTAQDARSMSMPTTPEESNTAYAVSDGISIPVS